MSLLALDRLSVLRGQCPVVDGASLIIRPGEFVGLLGPNGAGKTTLMRAALGLLPSTGSSNLAALRPGQRARRVAWMPQSREIAWPVDVATLVGLGRQPHQALGRGLTAEDHAAVDAALARMDLGAFRARIATQLSGGEQARVLIARALAQDTPLLMADEPVAGLDPAHQIATARVFADLAREGRAVIASLHDLGLGARHCTRLILMNRGQIVADGTPGAVLSPENLHDVFGVTAHYAETAQGPVFQPLDLVER